MVAEIDKTVQDNHPLALENHRRLQDSGVVAISILGGPGCGKTSLIEETIRRMRPQCRVGVIACDIQSHVDADRIGRNDVQVVHVATGEKGMPTAEHVRDAINKLGLDRIDLLFIENIGTLLCDHAPDLGQDAAVTVFSVAGGDDKAEKHPELVKNSQLIILTKTDLLDVVPFDLHAFREDVRRLNTHAQLIELSAYKGHGMAAWLEWLKTRLGTGEADRLLSGANWFG